MSESNITSEMKTIPVFISSLFLRGIKIESVQKTSIEFVSSLFLSANKTLVPTA